jgi:hypothetical protein
MIRWHKSTGMVSDGVQAGFRFLLVYLDQTGSVCLKQAPPNQFVQDEAEAPSRMGENQAGQRQAGQGYGLD